ncbi:ComEA family DNA-binding protein [Parathermosynechococcus lividus]
MNSANKKELKNAKIPDIGSKTAEKIIQFREENDLFRSIDDLKEI